MTAVTDIIPRTSYGSVLILNEWVRVTLTFTTPSGCSLVRVQLLANTNTSGNIGFWGAQLVEGINALDYFATETRLNIPRLDYSNGSCPSLLVEPQRTNLLTFSSNVANNTAWPKFISGVGIIPVITANSSVSPRGILEASLVELSLNGGTSINDRSAYRQSAVSVTSGQLYAASFWLKAFSPSDVGKVISFAPENTTNTPVLITLTADWERHTVITTANTSSMNFLFQLRGTIGTADNVRYYHWNNVMEQGNYPTSDIITTSASVTRNADVISKTGIADLIGQSEGAFYLELKEAAGGTDKMIQLSDGSDNNNISIQFINNNIRLTTVGGGAGYRVLSIPSNVFQNNKIVLVWKAGNIFGYVNGVKYTLTLFSGIGNGIPTTLNRINLSFWWMGQPFFGNINQILVFKKQLTDAECIALTTL
jgi:hypothetical protein